MLPRDDVAAEIKSLSQDERAKLRNMGVRFGAITVFLPTLLKQAATELRLLLWWLDKKIEATVPAPPPNGLTSALADVSKPDGYYQIAGYRVCNTRAVRVDMLERLSDLIRDRVFWKPRIPEEQRRLVPSKVADFTVFPDLMSLVGCSGEEFSGILSKSGVQG